MTATHINICGRNFHINLWKGILIGTGIGLFMQAILWVYILTR